MMEYVRTRYTRTLAELMEEDNFQLFDFDYTFPEEHKAEMENYATEYMVSLKTVLVENMKAGGPQLAINVCADTAMTLAKNYSESR